MTKLDTLKQDIRNGAPWEFRHSKWLGHDWQDGNRYHPADVECVLDAKRGYIFRLKPLPKSLPGTPCKVPFRAVYCETRWEWVKECFVCLYRTALKNISPFPKITTH